MTIGIAAFGPNAGRAILHGLCSAEAVTTGAIGGFVSVAAIDGGGRLHRAGAQTGGGTGLLRANLVPLELLSAERAVLMASGPHRPEPLAQFTPADPAVGLVTGHRFLNNPDRHGVPLGEAVFERMRRGVPVEGAVAAVLAENPEADMGLIALSLDGRIRLGDTAYVERFGGRGSALVESPRNGARVGILHNAIRPAGTLAPFLAETVLEQMAATRRPEERATLRGGIRARQADTPGLALSPNGGVAAVLLSDPAQFTGRWSLGVGYRAPVWRDDAKVGHALDDPYLVVEDGVLVSIDGADERAVRWCPKD